MSVGLALFAALIGFSIGAIGVGGIFLIPFLIFVVPLPVETAVGTSLVTFVATGFVATLLYARRGRVEWRLALWISAGSSIAAPFGARLAVALPALALKYVLATFLVGAGVATLARRPPDASAPHPLSTPLALVSCGALVGFGAGLTGVGGPAILVPVLLLAGFPATAAIAASQPNQFFASLAGAAGHAAFGSIDWNLALVLGACETAGVVLGAHFTAGVDAARLRPIAAGASIIAGVWTACRAALGG